MAGTAAWAQLLSRIRETNKVKKAISAKTAALYHSVGIRTPVNGIVLNRTNKVS
jgi:hypothetical protein